MPWPVFISNICSDISYSGSVTLVVYLWWHCLYRYMRSCRLFTLLTHSTVQSPSWEANWFAARQKIPRISRNPKVHYRTHKRPPPVCILGQPNPVHIPTSHLLENHPNIINPSTPRSPQWSLSLRFPQQDPIHPPLSPYTYILKVLRDYTFILHILYCNVIKIMAVKMSPLDSYCIFLFKISVLTFLTMV